MYENLTPKQLFAQDPTNVKQHRQTLDTPIFARACEVALLEYQLAVTQGVRDGNTAGAAGLRILGAQEVIQTLKCLTETPRAKTQRPSDNLTPTP